MPTAQQIASTQGTRLSETPPWMTYANEMTEKLEANLASLVDEYAERVYAAETASNQNKESLHEQREMSEAVAQQYQWLKPEEYSDQEARIGQPMHSSDFIGRLRSLGVVCWYRQHPQPQKATLMIQTKHGQAAPEVGCWVQLGFMPELSIMRFDEHGVPLDERRRGWRTCLLQLILKGVLTEETANKTFGRPRQTPAYHRYNSMLQAFRNAGGSLGA